MKKIEATTLQKTRLGAIIIFSGDLDPKPEAAAEALRKAGYYVINMPEELRPHLAHPRDDFLEVVKSIVCDPEDIMDEASNMMDELHEIVDHQRIVLEALIEIVDRFGALADDCGPIDVDHIPFAALFRGATLSPRHQ